MSNPHWNPRKLSDPLLPVVHAETFVRDHLEALDKGVDELAMSDLVESFRVRAKIHVAALGHSEARLSWATRPSPIEM